MFIVSYQSALGGETSMQFGLPVTVRRMSVRDERSIIDRVRQQMAKPFRPACVPKADGTRSAEIGAEISSSLLAFRRRLLDGVSSALDGWLVERVELSA